MEDRYSTGTLVKALCECCLCMRLGSSRLETLVLCKAGLALFGRFDLAALCGCRTLNFCLFCLVVCRFLSYWVLTCWVIAEVDAAAGYTTV